VFVRFWRLLELRPSPTITPTIVLSVYFGALLQTHVSSVHAHECMSALLSDHAGDFVTELHALASLEFTATPVAWTNVHRKLPSDLQAAGGVLRLCGMPAEISVRTVSFRACGGRESVVTRIAPVGEHTRGIVFGGGVCVHSHEEYLESTDASAMQQFMKELCSPLMPEAGTKGCTVCGNTTQVDDTGTERAHECCGFWAKAYAHFGDTPMPSEDKPGEYARDIWGLQSVDSSGGDTMMLDVDSGGGGNGGSLGACKCGGGASPGACVCGGEGRGFGDKSVLVRVEDRVLESVVYVWVVPPRSMLLALLAVADVVAHVLAPKMGLVHFPSPFTREIMGDIYAARGLGLDISSLYRVVAHYRPLFDRCSPSTAQRAVAFLFAFGGAVAVAGGVMGDAKALCLPYDSVAAADYLAQVNHVLDARRREMVVTGVALFVQRMRCGALAPVPTLERNPMRRDEICKMLCREYGRCEAGLTPHIKQALRQCTGALVASVAVRLPLQTRMTDFAPGGMGALLQQAREHAGPEHKFVSLLALVRGRFAVAQLPFIMQTMRVSEEQVQNAREEECVKHDMCFLVHVLALNWPVESRVAASGVPAVLAAGSIQLEPV